MNCLMLIPWKSKHAAVHSAQCQSLNRVVLHLYTSEHSRMSLCATSWSLVQRSPTDCGVSECDDESSIRGGRGTLVAVALRETILCFCSVCLYTVSASACIASNYSVTGHSNCDDGVDNFGRIISVAAVREFTKGGRERLRTVMEL